MNDAYLNCIKEYIRVSELCREYNEENFTDINPWELVSYKGMLTKFSSHPPFLANQDLSKYEFAIDILEDKPVFSWEVDKDILLSMTKSELIYVVEMLGSCTEHYRLWKRLEQVLNNH